MSDLEAKNERLKAIIESYHEAYECVRRDLDLAGLYKRVTWIEQWFWLAEADREEYLGENTDNK